MTVRIQRITIVRTTKPQLTNINEELQWLGGTLGLFNLRDKDRSCFRLFIELVKSSRNEEEISSDDLAVRLGLTRGTVVHHLNKLLEAGIIINNRNRYVLRVNSLSELIKEIEADFNRVAKEMQEVANDVDRKLGFK